MTLVAASAARGAARASDARIAFVRSGDIWTIRSDGKGLRRVTYTPNNAPLPAVMRDSEPAWSPDGRWIAFVRTVGSRGPGLRPRHIYVVRPNGRGLRFVTEGRSPTWFPDGQRIAFARDGLANPDAGGPIGSYSVRLNGMDERVIRECVYPPQPRNDEADWCINDYVYDLAVSPEGSRIAWAAEEYVGGLDIEIFDLASRESTWLYGPDEPHQHLRSPDWSPNGRSLAVFVEGSGARSWVATVRPDGTRWRLITSVRGPVGHVSWSPLARRLVVAGFERKRIFIVHRDGTHRRFLTRGTEPDWQPLPPPP